MRLEGQLPQGGYILGWASREVLPMQGSLSKETRGCLGECSFPARALSDILPWKRWVPRKVGSE